MTITLEFNIKDGKNAIKAHIIEDSPAEARATYDQLLAHFPISPTPATTKTKKSDDSVGECAEGEPFTPAEPNVVDIQKGAGSTRAAKKLFSQQALALNEMALFWAGRMAMAIPEFRGKSAQELADQLNFRKPIATMEIPELQDFIKLLQDTLKLYADNNPGVAVFLKVFKAIDGLKTGTDEEWQEARKEISKAEWDLLATPENKAMFDYAKSHLQTQQKVLQAAAAASAMAVS